MENEINVDGFTDAQKSSLASPLVTVSRVVKMDEATRRVTHVISTAKLDRGSRIIEQSGWQLSDYKKNNVVLADHDYSVASIIGSGHDVAVVKDELQATTEFGEEGLGPLAFRLVQSGLAKAWSVGWNGIKGHSFGMGAESGCAVCEALKGKAEWGYHYVKQALLEYSLVAVPANPDAVMKLEAAGFTITKRERDLWMSIGPEKTPAEAAALTGANVDEVPLVIPSRSSDFYDELFKLGRSMTRRVSALTQAKRFNDRR